MNLKSTIGLIDIRYRKYTIGAAFALLIAGLVSYVLIEPTYACPDDFPDTDQGSELYLAATNKWTNDFFDNNPDASLGDWARARHQFWIDNSCTAALERYEEAKRMEPSS